MRIPAGINRLLALTTCTALSMSGCAFQGLNSLPLPGTVGRGPDSSIYHVEIANVGTLESNSPVMIDDVVVGSIGKITARNWHAEVDVFVKPQTVVPANAVASVGQTSLLGSMHLSLDPPPGQPPRGRLAPGATIRLNNSMTYPSTEQTLSALAAVVNGGGLGQISDIVHNLNVALSGHVGQTRDLINQFHSVVSVLDRQRDNITATIDAFNRLAGTLSGQREVIATALQKIPPALDVLIKQRPRIITALDKLRQFSDTATTLIRDTQADLVKNLQNLQPTLAALADVGKDLDLALAYATTFPYSQSFIDRAVRGDYLNVYSEFDFTLPRLKRTLALGTRWGQEGAELVPAPGDPWFLNYTYDPLSTGVAAQPDDIPQNPPVPDAAPTPPGLLPEGAANRAPNVGSGPGFGIGTEGAQATPPSTWWPPADTMTTGGR